MHPTPTVVTVQTILLTFVNNCCLLVEVVLKKTTYDECVTVLSFVCYLRQGGCINTSEWLLCQKLGRFVKYLLKVVSRRSTTLKELLDWTCQ